MNVFFCDKVVFVFHRFHHRVVEIIGTQDCHVCSLQVYGNVWPRLYILYKHMVFGSVSHLSFSNMVLTQCKHEEYEAEKKKTWRGCEDSGVEDYTGINQQWIVFMVNYLKSEIKKKIKKSTVIPYFFQTCWLVSHCAQQILHRSSRWQCSLSHCKKKLSHIQHINWSIQFGVETPE